MAGHTKAVIDTSDQADELARLREELERTKAACAVCQQKVGELRESEEKYRVLLDESSDPIFSIQPDGVSFILTTYCGDRKVKLQVTGRFNVYNALCAAAVALSLGVELDTIVTALEQVKGVKGRFEAVKAGQPFTILVDYSHTPDSLENALLTIREFCQGKVITVVGAGGDRDKTKRPLMAKIAAQYSDVTVLTSDNPRTEDPEKILDDMESGIRDQNVTYERIVLRAEAIRYAILHAKEKDVILIAGKGHENYQIIGTTKYHFDDCEIARAMVKEVYP